MYDGYRAVAVAILTQAAKDRAKGGFTKELEIFITSRWFCTLTEDILQVNSEKIASRFIDGCFEIPTLHAQYH